MDNVINPNVFFPGPEAPEKRAVTNMLKRLIIIILIAAVTAGAIYGGVMYYGRSLSMNPDEAAAIALRDAGIDAGTPYTCRFGIEDGLFCYDIIVKAGDSEYDYSIHSETGAILERSIDGAKEDFFTIEKPQRG